jgi:hypothetical protein
MDRRRFELVTIAVADAEIADVGSAAAARSFNTCVPDGLGAQLDAPTAGTFPPARLEPMIVGRPVAES